MSERSPERQSWERGELLSLLSASATLAGLCITVVALMKTIGSAKTTATVVDDIFGDCAAAFLLCTYLIFWAMRAPTTRIAQLLTAVVDVLFLLALSAMTLAALIMLYSIW